MLQVDAWTPGHTREDILLSTLVESQCCVMCDSANRRNERLNYLPFV